MAGNTQFTDGFSGIVYAITVLTGFGESSMEVISIGGKAMVVIMMIAGACVVGVPLGIISGEFTTMVEKAAHQHDEEDEDLFVSFTNKLSVEQKLKIIAEYQKELEEKDNDNNEN